MLILVLMTRSALGYQYQTIGSSEALLREEFGLTFAEIGTLIGVYLLPGVFISYPAGLLIRRVGEKAACSSGLLLMALGGALLGLADRAEFVTGARLLSGSGAVLLAVSTTKMATDWFAGRQVVVAMSLLLTSWPVGTATALVLFAYLAEMHDWRQIMFAGSAGCVAAAAISMFLYRNAPRSPSDEISTGELRSALAPLPRDEALSTIIAGLAWGFFNLGLITFFSFVPPLLQENGTSGREGAFLTSIALWLMLLSMPLGGYIIERCSRPEMGISLFSGLTGIVLVCLCLFPGWALGLIVAMGLLLGPPPGAIMAMPGHLLRPENRAPGLGLFLTVFYIAVTVGPFLAGLARQSFGPNGPVLFGAGCFLAIPPLLAVYSARTAHAATNERSPRL
ncbi:MFS transporter [Micromonospora sp. STR1s_5]|nr:MFS transporter [Micromonospora sp. STR1s_5]